MTKPKTCSNILRYRLATLLMAGTSAAAIGAAQPARALSLYNNGQMEINLTTTVEYSTFYRVNNPSAILESDVNGDDGDRNFRHGIVSNLFSVLPVLDLKDGNYGAHFSGEAYLNPNYLTTNDNNSPATYNPISTGKNTDFTSATRNVNGENAVLLDAFVYGTKYFGANDEQEFTAKIGRSTLLWGQSLFFSNNGIAAGMAPVDVQLADSLPNAQTQQILLPVGQVVLTYQPNQTLTFQGYYQFEWKPDNLEGVGSYFSSTDVLDKGGQRIIDGTDIYSYRGRNVQPQHNPQFGISVQATLGNYDLGLYALRYDSKAPELINGAPGLGGAAGPNMAGSYWLAYPRDIQVYGAAISTTVGPVNVAGELSGRRNMPLVSGVGEALFATSYPSSSTGDNTPWATGSTMAGQVSAIYASPGLPFDPGGVSVTAEYAMNHVLSVDSNRDLLTAGRNGTAGQFEVVVTPQYFNFFPQTVVTFPIGITYNLFGRSEIDSTENHGTGALTLGVTATYNTVWIAGLTYKDYLGAPAPGGTNSANPDADRGYLSFNIEHTF